MANRLSNYPVIRDSQGEQTTPTAATVMADTGAIGAVGGQDGGGVYEITVVVSATAIAEFALQRRNAANGANVGDVHVFYCPAGSFTFKWVDELEKGERFRIVMDTTLAAGVAVANIAVQRVA